MIPGDSKFLVNNNAPTHLTIIGLHLRLIYPENVTSGRDTNQNKFRSLLSLAVLFCTNSHDGGAAQWRRSWWCSGFRTPQDLSKGVSRNDGTPQDLATLIVILVELGNESTIRR